MSEAPDILLNVPDISDTYILRKNLIFLLLMLSLLLLLIVATCTSVCGWWDRNYQYQDILAMSWDDTYWYKGSSLHINICDWDHNLRLPKIFELWSSLYCCVSLTTVMKTPVSLYCCVSLTTVMKTPVTRPVITVITPKILIHRPVTQVAECYYGANVSDHSLW